ncbi:MAG TPA: hypothetical protein VK537_07555 [Galbitalea sp.]|nr:hypothetical protein [Galbitalea sp.]
MSFEGRTREQCRQFIASQNAIGRHLTATEVFIIDMLGELVAHLIDLKTQIGESTMATQADVDALTQQVQNLNGAWQAWAANAATILTNVETALTAAEQANGIQLTDALAAVADGQAALAALPAESDPTVAPPTPATGS